MSTEKMFHDLEKAIEEDFAAEQAIEELEGGYRGRYLRVLDSKWGIDPTGGRRLFRVEVNGRLLTLSEVDAREEDYPYAIRVEAVDPTKQESEVLHTFAHLSQALGHFADVLGKEKF